MIPLAPRHLLRYRGLGGLLLKYGQTELLRQTGLDRVLDRSDRPATVRQRDRARELTDDLEKLGPTYIKLGQLLSTRPDLVGDEYLQEFRRLQDDVQPVPEAEIRRTIREQLGADADVVYRRFDPHPLACASLGQVHLAETRDGREVVVKVQRPGVRRSILGDLDMLEQFAGFVDENTDVGRRYEFRQFLIMLRKLVVRELDYREEASHALTLRRNLRDFPDLVVAQPVLPLTTEKVLTLEFIAGVKVIAADPERVRLADGPRLAEELFTSYLHQVLVDGFFHADPHPGNILLTPEGRLALLDTGMVGKASNKARRNILRLLLAISEGDGSRAADITAELGAPRKSFDRDGMARAITEIALEAKDRNLADTNVGRVVLDVLRAAGRNGFRLDESVHLLGKTMMHLDETIAALDPHFDHFQAVRNYGQQLIESQVLETFSTSRLYQTMLDTTDLASRLPDRLNKILHLLSENDLALNVDLLDEQKVLRSMQKIANRITAGLVLAALIVGASLIMNIKTQWMLFGYPALAILFFLIAAGGGLYLVFHTLFTDE